MTRRANQISRHSPIISAMGHHFGPDMRCEACQTLFETHQRARKPCTAPKKVDRGGRPSGKVHEKVCPACGIEFETKRATAITCSRRCGARRKQQRANERKRQERADGAKA